MWLGFKEVSVEVREGFLKEVGLMTGYGGWTGSEEAKGTSMTDVERQAKIWVVVGGIED